jgi:polyhydroxybutyrate depolymerase
MLVYFGVHSVEPTYAQRQTYFIPPKDTDGEITTDLEPHYVALNKSVSPKNQLFLFFPGTSATPQLYQQLSNIAADLGFHVIGLNYPNDRAVNTLCGGTNTDLDCYANVRLEIKDGIDRTPLVNITRADSIENRLIKLLVYLRARFPNDGWGEFLESDGAIKWSSIVTSGHSQGGGHAGIIGRYHLVARVVMFAAMDYNGRLMRPANWIAVPSSTPNATPTERFYGFSHQRDQAVNFTVLSTLIWPAYGMTAFGPVVNVDTVAPPYSDTHSLTSNLDAPSRNYHSTIAVDLFVPKFPDGTLVYKPVWEYLLTAPPPSHMLTTVGHEQAPPPGTYDRSLLHGGLIRTYRLHIPPSHSRSKSTALVLALHGGGGTGQGMEKLTGLTPLSDREGFIIVYPNALGGLWNDGVQRTQRDTRNIDDVGFIDALMSIVAQELDIDRGRVYVTGISNGGHMANRLATELSHRIAAIGVVGATMEAEYAVNHAPIQPVSFIYFHGTVDPLRFFGGGGVAGGNTLSARAMTQWWVEKNGCSRLPQTEDLPDRTDDGTRVRREIFAPCRAGTEVVFYIIEGGGHTWPGGWQYWPESAIGRTSRDIDASELIWEFFNRHPQRTGLFTTPWSLPTTVHFASPEYRVSH